MISLDLAFVFQFVNFLVLMLVLNILLYKPVRKILSERDTEIASSREKTAEVDRDVQEKIALYEEKLRKTKAVAYEEKNKTLQKVREEESAIIETSRLEVAASVASIQRQVAAEADQARHFLREQAQVISREICEKVLGRSCQ
ncbi:MAG: atpX [Geobacteraceae bacterium]|jgi:F-type H+-transporting ATPase subunit b|nr:atpX [Geobacteraceae bacterium]